MKLRVLKTGRIAYPEIRQLGAMYHERLLPLARPTQIESLEFKDDAQVARLLGKTSHEHQLIVLDERGEDWTSKAFAAQLQRRIDDPAIKSVSFLLGGPLGLSAEQKQQAHGILRLSQATMTSDLAWLILWEQLYRAFNILRGTAYHHA